MRFKEGYSRTRDEEPPAGFCWGFCVAVFSALGLASFLMFSAWGRFSGVAWGSVENQNAIAAEGFITLEVTEAQRESLLAKLAPLPEEPEPQRPVPYVSEVTEDFGPLPKYLSGYEDIVLNVQDDGTRMPKNEDDEAGQDNEAVQPEPEVQLAEAGASWREHIVKSGETLSDIALAYGGLTAQDILRANGLKDANRLATNQLLLIPHDPSKVEETLAEVRVRQMRVAAAKEKVEPLKVLSYVVAPGDSLWSISNAQNIELDTLVGSNTFKSSATLRPGAVLRIPNQEGIFYVLRKGEKIDDVCKRYGVSLSKVRQVNAEINFASLKAGEEVFLPGARPGALVEPHEDKKVADKDPGKKPAKQPIKLDIPVKSSGSTYRWPLMGRINSPFGWRQHPLTKRRDFHTGIDIKGDRGTLIKGAGDGKVAYSGWMGGYGKVIVIDHANGQSTLYAHCSSLLVPKGASVSKGQDIARVGTTGRTTGPHLHFEVRSGNSPVNPLKYLK